MKMEMGKVVGLAAVMDSVAGEKYFFAEKRMSDEDLDTVAGGYRYGRVSRNEIDGMVIYTMHNLNTKQVEVYYGKTDDEAMKGLVRHNFRNREKTIVLTKPNGKVYKTFNVNALAKDMGLKR